MNQGAVHSSLVVPPGSANWSVVTNMRAPPRQPLQPHSHLYNHQELHHPWSQLLLGSGLLDEVEKKTACVTTEQNKKLHNWDEQLMIQIPNDFACNLKQETSLESYADRPFNSWTNQMMYDSSPRSCVTSLSYNMLDFTHKSSEGKPNHLSYSDPLSECNSSDTSVAAKKARIQPSLAQSTFKVRKESLRDKITAIHQLVSPFGKTDTATVLGEAIGYIRFLQKQIEALSLPYLSSGSRNMNHQHHESDKEREGGLKRKGLCLVPAATLHFERDINAADYWASASFDANFQ